MVIPRSRHLSLKLPSKFPLINAKSIRAIENFRWRWKRRPSRKYKEFKNRVLQTIGDFIRRVVVSFVETRWETHQMDLRRSNGSRVYEFTLCWKAFEMRKILLHIGCIKFVYSYKCIISLYSHACHRQFYFSLEACLHNVDTSYTACISCIP